MEQYGKILIIAMPVFLALIALEKWYGWYKGHDTVPIVDAVSSLSSGITNVVKDVLGLSISILSYEWMVQKTALFSIENHWITYVIAFVVIDFYGYWTHRWAHQINFFWNKHAIHHSSEEFNLPCALRQSISSWVNLFTFLLLPAALVGVPAKVIATILPLHLFAQFWYHTKHIGKLGWLENIIVTPSHHRVHHAINPEYLDKNHGQIFIFWDKWFGTFQEEVPNVPAVYGITRPASTWNPIKINYQHLWLLMQDAWRANRWKDKFTIWFQPTGWRPDGMEDKFPVKKIEHVYQQEKYQTFTYTEFKAYSIFQLFSTLLLLSLFFNHIGKMNLTEMLAIGFFIFWNIYSYTDVMDGNASGWKLDVVKTILFILIWIQIPWFASQITVVAFYVLLSYLIISNFWSWRIHQKNKIIAST